MTVAEGWGSGFVDRPGRQCAGKHCFATRSAARKAIKAMRGRGADKLMIYRCPHCDSLHAGHAPSGSRARRQGP